MSKGNTLRGEPCSCLPLDTGLSTFDRLDCCVGRQLWISDLRSEMATETCEGLGRPPLPISNWLRATARECAGRPGRNQSRAFFLVSKGNPMEDVTQKDCCFNLQMDKRESNQVNSFSLTMRKRKVSHLANFLGQGLANRKPSTLAGQSWQSLSFPMIFVFFGVKRDLVPSMELAS